jgi:hypothetical protein
MQPVQAKAAEGRTFGNAAPVVDDSHDRNQEMRWVFLVRRAYLR